MKGLKKIALATAVAAVPFAAQAELKAMDDVSMGSVTGQSGITVELAANVSVGEIAYQDDGFLAINDLVIGGNDGAGNVAGALDDVKLYIDVAGTGGVADTGAGAIGNQYLVGADAAGLATWTNTETDPTTGVASYEAGMPEVQDGDLVIGIRSVSGVPVDFGVGIGSVQLAKSTSTVGDLSSTAGTTLVSDLQLTGLLGPIDIVIQEDTSVMNINAYFNAAGSLNADFVGTYLDFALHNSRGADQNSLNGAVSFAHAQVDIGLATNAAGEDALAFNVNNFSGDLDLTNIRMGSDTAPSIGDVYMTDVAINAQMTVYGH